MSQQTQAGNAGAEAIRAKRYVLGDGHTGIYGLPVDLATRDAARALASVAGPPVARYLASLLADEMAAHGLTGGDADESSEAA